MAARLWKNIGSFALIATFAVADNGRAAETTWTTLSPKGDGFSIDVPGKPTPSSKPSASSTVSDS